MMIKKKAKLKKVNKYKNKIDKINILDFKSSSTQAKDFNYK